MIRVKPQFDNKNPMSGFVFIDVNTQKELIEYFGANPIPDCAEIRENLMDLVSYGMRNKLPILSLVNDKYGEKILDTECERWAKFGQQDEETQQVLFAGEKEQVVIDLMSYLQDLQPENLVVFGVPLELEVADLVRSLAGAGAWRIWLLRDAVKGYEDPEDVFADLRKLANVSLMSTRNTLKYLSELGENFLQQG